MRKRNNPFQPRSRSYSERRVELREQLQSFLIVCEGEKTEPNYFRAFPATKSVIEVEGVGGNTFTVVNEALRLRQRRRYDQVWCVFDKDSFDDNHFMGAIHRAQAQGINVAYSNEAFELWYILHFDYLVASVARSEYQRMLTQRLGRPYRKDDPSLYESLLPRQELAIRNSDRLLRSYNPCHPHRDNPSTTVHLLVQALRQHSDSA